MKAIHLSDMVEIVHSKTTTHDYNSTPKLSQVLTRTIFYLINLTLLNKLH